MCVSHLIHYHHFYPCTRGIDIVLDFAYCALATVITLPDGTRARQPCKNLGRNDGDAYPCVGCDNPCAASSSSSGGGGCLASPDCLSGACRLEQLGGRWACCRCLGGGNEFRWCAHPMRQIPDTFCSHVCCAGCWADPRGWPPDGEHGPAEGATQDGGVV